MKKKNIFYLTVILSVFSILFIGIIWTPNNSLSQKPLPQETILPDSPVALSPTPEELNNPDTAIEAYTLDELRSVVFTQPEIIRTSGYHFPNDGGAATYQITNDSALTPNNTTVIELSNGFKALLQIENAAITPEQFGAYGDGAHDDVYALQAALDSGFTVNMTPGHAYLLSSNGLFFRTNTNLLGNNATLLINDTYNPTDVDSFGKRILRNKFCDCQSLAISDLNISVNFSDNRYINDYLVVLQPTFFENVILNNVNIDIARSNNRITAFWMDHGCRFLSLNNCTFVNNTYYKNGGIIFLHSNTDTVFNKYNGFDNVTINNCNLSGSCGDEVLAIWGQHSQNVTITNSNLNWMHEAVGSNRPIAIYSDQDTHANFNVAFQNCTLKCSNVPGISGNECDAFIGVGSSYAGNLFTVTFEQCDIDAQVNGSLIYPSCFQKDQSHLGDFDLLNRSVYLNFNNSNIKCNMPITGNNSSFIKGSRTVRATDCSFNNCSITCRYAFAYAECTSSSKSYYVPTINIQDCPSIIVEQPNAFIYQTNYSASVNGSIVNSNINGNGINKLITPKYKTTVSNAYVTQQNASNANLTVNNTLLNQKQQ